MKATTVKEVLIAARWILQHYGWVQGTFYLTTYGLRVPSIKALEPGDTLKACCLTGALRLVEVEDRIHGLFDRTYDLVRQSAQEARWGVSNWNDTPGRTKEEVIALLDKAIAKA